LKLIPYDISDADLFTIDCHHYIDTVSSKEYPYQLLNDLEGDENKWYTNEVYSVKHLKDGYNSRASAPAA